MIIELKKIQLCHNGAELADIRLEYYQFYGTFFEKPPQKLQQIVDIKEDLEVLEKEYLNLFIPPNNKYFFHFTSSHIKGDGQQKDHLLFNLNQMCSLIKKEKRNWQRKNYLIAMNLLYKEQDYLLDQMDWLPSLCSQIQEKSTTQFYHEVALNLRDFLSFEKLLLNQILLKRANILN